MAKLILVSGASASGKTTIAQGMADVLHIPLFRKDVFKEKIFDSLGYSDVGWSQKVGKLSIDYMYLVAEQFARDQKDLILEANFRYDRDRDRLLGLQKDFPMEIVEIHCVASPEASFARYKARAESGERHPGHGDTTNYERMQEIFADPSNYRAMGLGSVLEIDTTEWIGDEVERASNFVTMSSHESEYQKS